jgi:hypothetical protein
MHMLIITFQLKGISEADYLTQSKEEAPMLAAFPGLHSKVWLADSATNTYGGVIGRRWKPLLIRTLSKLSLHVHTLPTLL